MALPDREKRSKPSRAVVRRPEVRGEREYVAKLVSLREICAFVRSHGTGDVAACWVAGRQLDLICFRQLRAAGISKDMITRRCQRGLLHRVHRKVYLLGTEIMLPGAWELAGVLACGPATVVSHRSAVALWGLRQAATDRVEVTVAGRNRRSRAGLHVHRVQALDPRDRRLHRGIPVTSPARSLLDYAASSPPDELERAIAEAYALKLVTEGEIHRALDRAPYRPGAGRLRAELAREAGPQWTQSDAERRMLRLIRAARLPFPQTQIRVAGWPADFLWPQHKLILEVDGYPFHSHRRAFERDRRRDAAHVAAGYRVIRVTYRQLREEPLAVAVVIARALEACARD
jgi:very-short-patch-repair endonuclease